MSSGLVSGAPQDPDYDRRDPSRYLTSTRGRSTRSAMRPPAHSSGRPHVGRYRNTDPVSSLLIRLGSSVVARSTFVSATGALRQDRHSAMVMETDPFGNFLTQGYELASARDWAGSGTSTCRTGCGTASGSCQRVRHVREHAGARLGGRQTPIYAGSSWINGNDEYRVPRDAVLHVGGRRPDDAHRTLARPRRRAARSLQGWQSC